MADEPATQRQREALIKWGTDPNWANDPRLTKAAASKLLDEYSAYAKGEGQKPTTPPRPGQQAIDKPAEAPGAAAAAAPSGETGLAQPDARKAMAAGADETPEFAPGTVIVSQYLVRPEVSIKQMVSVWETLRAFREHILSDPACYDEIEGSKEMNRTGATRLAVAFGLSVEQISSEEREAGDGDVRYTLRLRISKGARYVEAIGTSRLSEIKAETKKGGPVPIGQREHFAMTKAWTRAGKRGIADMLGGTEAE